MEEKNSFHCSKNKIPRQKPKRNAQNLYEENYKTIRMKQK